MKKDIFIAQYLNDTKREEAYLAFSLAYEPQVSLTGDKWRGHIVREVSEKGIHVSARRTSHSQLLVRVESPVSSGKEYWATSFDSEKFFKEMLSPYLTPATFSKKI